MSSNSGRRQDWHRAAECFRRALARHFPLSLKYSPDRPRVPAGNADGGQWAGQQGPNSILDDIGQGPGRVDLPVSSAPMQLAGGFEKEDMGKTVQDFVSEKCEGRIRAVLPSQFLDITIAEVLKLKGADASRCRKILKQDRFRK